MRLNFILLMLRRQSIRLDIKVEEINNINNLERHSESDGAVCIYADEYESVAVPCR